MRILLVGGAPGVGKTAAAEELLRLVADNERLVQWVDVDSLWRHQPWRVDDTTKAMVQANLEAVLANASTAGVDVLVLTWVFQSTEMHELVRSLSPRGTPTATVQLVADESVWRARFESDPARPPVDRFYEERYRGAQAVEVDHRIVTDGRTPRDVAQEIARVIR